MGENQMRRSIFVMAVAIPAMGTLPSQARSQPPSDLPPINVLGRPAAKADACASESGDRRLNCLNRKMQRQVDHISPPEISAPLGANSPDTKIGIVNLPAVQQQYGQNYGKSVIPFRPPPVSFAPALGHH
jgi:hypothetical protein